MAEVSPTITAPSASPSETTTAVNTNTSQDPSPKLPSSPRLEAAHATSSAAISDSSENHAVESAKRTAEARTAFLASLHSVGSSADVGLQTRAADIAANSNALAKQQDELDASAAALAKESDKYQRLADETRNKLKDIGDVQCFAEVIERELMVLEETLRIVDEGEEEDFGEEEEGVVEQEGKGLEKKKKWWF